MHIRLLILILLIIPVGGAPPDTLTSHQDNLTALLSEENQTHLLENFEAGAFLAFNETELLPRYDYLFRNLAAGLSYRGEYDRAVDILLLIPQDERTDDSVLLLAFIYTRMGAYQQALEEILPLKTNHPEDLELKNALGYILSVSGSPADAMKIMLPLRDQITNYGPALDTWGTILVAEGRLTEAKKSFQKALILLPDDAEVTAHLAEVYHRTGQHADAQDLYQQATDLDPGYGPAQKGYARTLIGMGRYPEAAQVIRTAIKLMPGDPDLISWEQEADAILLAWHIRQQQEADRPLLIRREVRVNHS